MPQKVSLGFFSPHHETHMNMCLFISNSLSPSLCPFLPFSSFSFIRFSFSSCSFSPLLGSFLFHALLLCLTFSRLLLSSFPRILALCSFYLTLVFFVCSRPLILVHVLSLDFFFSLYTSTRTATRGKFPTRITIIATTLPVCHSQIERES